MDSLKMGSLKMVSSTWIEIEKAFQEDWLVIIPLGSNCKEHGHHLPMNTDFILAENFAQYVYETNRNVIIAPTLTDSYFPAFVEYPGSLSLTVEVAREVIMQRCRIWHQQGANRFYVLNMGISTNVPLKQAKEIFSAENPAIQFDYLDLSPLHQDPRLIKICQQQYGTHADEIETSMMLNFAPEVVNLTKAKSEDSPKKPGPLTRDLTATDKTISVTGAWGNPTLATLEKGQIAISIIQEMIDQQLSIFQKNTCIKHSASV